MRLSVLRRSLQDSRRALAWWSSGLVGLVSMIVAVYPAIHHNRSLTKLTEDYPKALKAFIGFGGAVDYTTAAGYLGTELFSFMVPLLLLVVGIGAGARAIAGDERAGTFDLLLANPISRRRVVLERLGAVATEVLALAFVLWVVLAIATALAGMHIADGRLAAATAEAGLLALVFGALALLVGCAAGSTTMAVAIPAAGAVAAYLVNALAALVHGLEPIRKASPFYLYTSGDPLRRGVPLVQTVLLVVIAGVFAAVSPPALERRDLR